MAEERARRRKGVRRPRGRWVGSVSTKEGRRGPTAGGFGWSRVGLRSVTLGRGPGPPGNGGPTACAVEKARRRRT